MALAIGDTAPDFTLPGNGGETISLSQFKGKKTVLYFYPKDDTPGCTTEAKDFSSLSTGFAAENTVIVGMSKDSVAKHDKFIAKHDLNVLLTADEEGTTLEAYGAWVEKSMYGRTYMGIERATFLIDEKGIVRNIWRKVKVKGHADDVLKSAAAL